MVNPPRPRQRVHAIRRAPDGSAFEKCKNCGFSVAIALADMHECDSGTKENVKRFKGVKGNQNVLHKSSFKDQPRSPFRFFMQDFKRTCRGRNLINLDRKGFETWKNMPKEDRQPYVIKAQQVNSSYIKRLIEEIDVMFKGDEEADSAMVGKFDLVHEDYENEDNSDSMHSFCSKGFSSLNTWEWEMVKSWIVGSSEL